MAKAVLSVPGQQDVVLTPSAWAQQLPTFLDDIGDDIDALSALVMTAVDAGMASTLGPATDRLKPVTRTSAPAAVALAAALVAQGEHTAAEAVVDEHLRTNPQAPSVLLARAKLAALAGDERAAERGLQAVLDVDPNDPGAVNLIIARALARGGDKGARGAMRHMATRKGAWLALVRLGAMADAAGALPALNDAKRAANGAPHVVGLCLRVLLQRGEVDDALKFIDFAHLPEASKTTLDPEVLLPLIGALVASGRMTQAQEFIAVARQTVNDRGLLAELAEAELALVRKSVDRQAGDDVTAVPTRMPLYAAVLSDLAPSAPPPPKAHFLSFSLGRGPEQGAPVRDASGVAHAATDEERHVRGLPLWLAERLHARGLSADVSTTLGGNAGFYVPTSAWSLPLALSFLPREHARSGWLISGHVSTPTPGVTSIALNVFDLERQAQLRTAPVVGASFDDAATKALAQLERALGVSGAPTSGLASDDVVQLADLQALFFVASKTLSSSAVWHTVRALDSLAQAVEAPSPAPDVVKRAAAGYTCALALNLGGRERLRDALRAVTVTLQDAALKKIVTTLVTK